MNLCNKRAKTTQLVPGVQDREPRIYRGDGSDKFTIHEGVNLITLYLRKRNIPVLEHSEEIMVKLMGKAGNVVRIKLRNDTSTDYAANPHMIFSILKQHFSKQSYSFMPLADFYNTLTTPDEDAMDYWIRLNKTVDVSDECLRRQGRRIDDPGHEVSMMFIKHCPDQALASVLKFKSADDCSLQWSACEIQDRLDKHIQHMKTQAAAALERKVHSQSQMHMVDCPPVSDTATLPIPHQVAPTLNGSDNDGMRSLVNLLDRLIMPNKHISSNARSRCLAPGH